MFDEYFDAVAPSGINLENIQGAGLALRARVFAPRGAASEECPDPTGSESAQTYRYFTSVLGDAIFSASNPLGKIRRIGPNAYEAHGSRGRVAVILRFTSRSVVDLLLRRPPDHLLIFMDDNLWALKGADIPEGYRFRLAKKRETVLAPLLNITDEIVSPARRILARFDTKQRSPINAALHLPLPSLDHHEDRHGLHMVFSGDRTHGEDLASIARDLADLLVERPDITLTTFLGRHAPPVLRGANVRHLDPVPWKQFREFMRYNRFHVALYPSQPSEFSRSRSVSALIDAGLWGAAGLFASQEPYYSFVDDKHSGVLIDPAKGSWAQAISMLASDRVRLADMARQGQEHARAIGDRFALRRFWLGRLGLATDLTRRQADRH